MSLPNDLTSLLALADPPVERVALAIARDADPHLDEAHWLGELDALAAAVKGRLQRAGSPLAQAGTLGTYLYDELGFRGNEASYYDARNSFLHEVIARRTGIPITLAIVLLAVGRHAGITIDGVGFPGHFLVRVGGPEGVYIDPFFHARVLDEGALERLLQRAAGHAARLHPSHLAVADARTIAVRLLANLKAIYESQNDHARALVVCDRLVDVDPVPENRRDRGRHALELGAAAAAIADLEAYLAMRTDASDAATVARWLERARRAGRSSVH